jgi:hypothetical protein
LIFYYSGHGILQPHRNDLFWAAWVSATPSLCQLLT